MWKIMIIPVLIWLAIVGGVAWLILAADWYSIFGDIGSVTGELVRSFNEASAP